MLTSLLMLSHHSLCDFVLIVTLYVFVLTLVTQNEVPRLFPTELLMHNYILSYVLIGNIRTVRAFAMEDTEILLYKHEVEKAAHYNTLLALGIGDPTVRMSTVCCRTPQFNTYKHPERHFSGSL